MKFLGGIVFMCMLMIQPGCQKEPNEPVPYPEAFSSDIAYGTASDKQKMDVYLPAGRNNTETKSIILIHGGAWIEGDKADFYGLMDALKANLPGWAIFNLNYRLADTATHSNLFPTQEQDIQKAMEYIYSHRGDYHVSEKFVLLGASAGAHLAQLQAYKYNTPFKPKALVSLFGPTSMIDMYDYPASPFIPASFLETILQGSPVSNPGLYEQSSPLFYITAQSPPTISFHGGLDFLVRPAQQDSLHARLDSYGVVNQKVFYPTEGHGWTGNNLTHTFMSIQTFLNANVP